MVSTEDSDASWFILFLCVFVLFVFFPAAESFIVVFILGSLSQLWWGLFGFCLSADFWLTKRSPAGRSSSRINLPEANAALSSGLGPVRRT